MKELSIEEKAKAYDEAFKEASVAHKDEDRHLKATLERIFPELKGSEDEKIRKRIIQALHGDVLDIEEISKAIVWLEKQESVGEIVERCKNSWYNEGKIQGQIEGLSDEEKYQQGWHDALEKQGDTSMEVICTREVEVGNGNIKALVTEKIPIDKVETKDYSSIDPHFGKPIDKMSADKVESKFKNGQWIVWQDKCYKVNYNGCGYELFDQNGLSTSWGYKAVEDNAHLWDVTKDAKPGDVLYSQKYNLIWIYKDNKHYYASINLNYADGISFEGDIVIPSDVCPATKEQRDLLFGKIKENGYDWDADKKELKKIEQKPSWSEEDEMFVHGLIRGLSAKRDIHGHTTFSSDCIDITETINWLKSLKERYIWKPSDE